MTFKLHCNVYGFYHVYEITQKLSFKYNQSAINTRDRKSINHFWIFKLNMYFGDNKCVLNCI